MARVFTTTNSAATTDEMNVGASALLNPTAMTISAWHYVDALAPLNYLVLVIRRQSAGGAGIYQLLRSPSPASGKMAYYIHCSGGPQLGVDPGSNTMSLNTWNHVAMSYDSSGGLKTYLNGASDGTVAANGTVFQNTGDNVYIGGDPINGLNIGLKCTVADVAMWNLSLTSAEISSLAKGARPYFIRPLSLAGYWPIDGLKSPEPDLSGNAFNGTLQGTPAYVTGPAVAMFTPRWPINIAAAAAAPSTIFRKSASRIGTRTGTRQTWAA